MNSQDNGRIPLPFWQVRCKLPFLPTQICHPCAYVSGVILYKWSDQQLIKKTVQLILHCIKCAITKLRAVIRQTRNISYARQNGKHKKTLFNTWNDSPAMSSSHWSTESFSLAHRLPTGPFSGHSAGCEAALLTFGCPQPINEGICSSVSNTVAPCVKSLTLLLEVI